MVLLLLAGVSGTGKGTVGAQLRARFPQLQLSVSHTTRAPRPGEQEGREYHFVERPVFEQTIEAGGFAEWAGYAGNLYGTARSTIDAAREAGIDLLFDIEVVGTAALKAAYPREAVSVFLLPPAWAELERRLRDRGTETEERIRRRLDTGRQELKAAHDFDYLVVNDVLEEAVEAVASIYRAAAHTAGQHRPLLERLQTEAALRNN